MRWPPTLFQLQRLCSKIFGFAISSDKLKPFDKEAEILGVLVDFSSFLDGKLDFKMKESRRTELISAMENLKAAGRVVPNELPSFLGRVQFAEGQLMGRAGKLAMADLREIGLTSPEPITLNDENLAALSILHERFLDNRPRSISLLPDDNPVLIYTDGSSEGSTAMIGGVMIDGPRQVRVVGCHVPPELFNAGMMKERNMSLDKLKCMLLLWLDICGASN